jgi:SAM-dependent methyltransferase
MVKLYPVVLYPLLLRRFGMRGLWPGLVVMAALATPYAATYVIPHMLDSVRLYTSLFEFNAGLYLGAKAVMQTVTGVDWSKTLGPVFSGLYVLALPALYVLDARHDWSLPRAMLIVLGLYLVLTTTVHPWYLLAVLPLLVLQQRVAWHWFWLAAASLGTYLLYRPGGEPWYWTFVILGWGGWGVLAARAYGDSIMQAIQRRRARSKVDFIAELLPASAAHVLDLGAGEGYVGAEIARRTGATVELLDVLPMNRTRLPHRVYDGRHIPFEAGRFDVSVLYFVLHHCAVPRQVVREALRVTEGPVIVVESVYTSRWNRRLLHVLDRWVNRLRSGGAMVDQEEYLQFRTMEGWKELFVQEGATVHLVRRRGRYIHRQAAFVVE